MTHGKHETFRHSVLSNKNVYVFDLAQHKKKSYLIDT